MTSNETSDPTEKNGIEYDPEMELILDGSLNQKEINTLKEFSGEGMDRSESKEQKDCYTECVEKFFCYCSYSNPNPAYCLCDILYCPYRFSHLCIVVSASCCVTTLLLPFAIIFECPSVVCFKTSVLSMYCEETGKMWSLEYIFSEEHYKGR